MLKQWIQYLYSMFFCGKLNSNMCLDPESESHLGGAEYAERFPPKQQSHHQLLLPTDLVVH